MRRSTTMLALALLAIAVAVPTALAQTTHARTAGTASRSSFVHGSQTTLTWSTRPDAPLAPCLDDLGQASHYPFCVSTVRNESSGLCLTPQSITSGALIQQERCEGTRDQTWGMIKSSGYYYLVNVGGSQTKDGAYIWCADVAGKVPGIGSHLVLDKCANVSFGQANQPQAVSTVPTEPEPYFHLQLVKDPPPCLSSNNSKRQGSLLYLAKCSTSENQAWYGTTLANGLNGGW